MSPNEISEKLSVLTVKSLVNILKDLSGGAIGFDPYRDARTRSKSGLITYIIGVYAPEAIEKRLSAQMATNSSQHGDSEEIHPPTQFSQAFFDECPPTPTESTPPVEAASPSDTANQLALLLTQLASPKALPPDETRINQLISTALTAYDQTAFSEDRAHRFIDAAIKEAMAAIHLPTRIEIKPIGAESYKDLGVQHKHFPLLLASCQAIMPDGHRLNIWLKGPAGSGKTTAAKKCAEALSLPFRFNGAISTEYALTGFIDASGRYHRTAFRDAYEHGGVYLFDEVDSSNPNAVLAFNAALANGVCGFPDGIISRHKDCVIIAGANTTGQGGTTEYVGRMKQDAAFLDRFVILDWPVDEALERALTANLTWFETVQQTRKNVAERSVKNHLITPRASLYGTALLAAGIAQKDVEQMVLRKGLPAETWKEIRV